ncbi:hypothetical protein PCCS19_36190 [Paenibacillus sp. CCS19]|nr:hypothetical protein PCCS19_36190 [Paenibacillus cellulosilyticus]
MPKHPSQRYYWSFKENRLSELNRFINEYGSTDYLLKTAHGSKIYGHFHDYDHSIEDALIELGYDLDKVRSRKTKTYYYNYDNLKAKIESFITFYGRFPTKMEIVKELKIDQRYVDAQGGIAALRRKIGYKSDSDYVDDNGYVNRSLMEFQIAQFLIHAGVDYQRDERICPNQGYKDDFYLLKDGTHVELWGYTERAGSRRHKAYVERKNKKLAIYASLDASLIELEYHKLAQYSYKRLFTFLCVVFEAYIPENYRFDRALFIRRNSISDDAIMTQIRQFMSDGDNHLPEVKLLQSVGLGHLVRIIRKRHGNYHSFGKLYSLVDPNKIIDMTDINNDYIFKAFDELSKTKCGITTRGLTEGYSVNTLKWLAKNGGYFLWRMKHCELLLMRGIRLDDSIIRKIFNITTNRHLKRDIKRSYEAETIAQAKIILNKLRHDQYYAKLIKKMVEEKPYTEEELEENFLRYASGEALTPAGFAKVSPIPVKAYSGFFKDSTPSWWQICDRYGRLEELTAYITTEYRVYLAAGNPASIRTFGKQHTYINKRTMDYKPFQEWYALADTTAKQKHFTEDELNGNFNAIKNQLGRLPTFSEFRSLGKIGVKPYIRFLGLHRQDYAAILLHYGTKEELDELDQYKKEATRARVALEDRTKISQEELNRNFHETFGRFYEENGKYPTKRCFNLISLYDESSYRNRFKCTWAQVVALYGYQ